jgi:hypothetical protein
MIYNQLNLQNQDFVNQSIGNSPKIIVEYNGTGIHTITGPVPVVDISYSFNNNNNNLPENITTSINLNGKILRHPEAGNIVGVDSNMSMPGFSGIIAGVSGLKTLFNSCPYGTLKFRCDNNTLYEISGLRVTNIQFNNTEDNWVQTADYSISLEVTNSLFSGTGSDLIEQYVTDRSDTWNIEPVDDATYVNFNRSVTNKFEYSNPKLNRINQTPTNTVTENNDLKIINIPQFRITRRLSAKGLLPDKNQICRSELYNENTKPYVFAKTWVENMSKKGFRTNSSAPDNSSPYFKNPFDQNLFAFNHNRTINIDIFNGSYEINDTWLAMPSGIPYTETYSVETSSGEDYVKTVRIQGNIIGLSITNQGLMTNSGVLPTGTGNNGVIDGQLKLDSYNTNNQINSTSYGTLDSATPGNNAPPQQTITSEKYNNALNAWTNHIKPYLYRRASLVLNSSDRTLDYIPPYAVNPPLAPNNPIYSRETLLSTIPVGTSEGHDPRKGTISYSYEYTNRLTIISGVITENINVNYENPTDSTSEIQIIGRALGPVIQRTGRSNPKKTISIEIGIPPVTSISNMSINSTTCPLHKSGYLFQTIEKIIEAHRPYSPSTFFPNEPIQTEGLVYTSSDSEQWSPTTGKYSRNVSWIYQQANLGRDFRDH